MKPELLVKEDNNELKCELQRKDELLRRHCDKIGQWQNLLADLQVKVLGTLFTLVFCTAVVNGLKKTNYILYRPADEQEKVLYTWYTLVLYRSS